MLNKNAIPIDIRAVTIARAAAFALSSTDATERDAATNDLVGLTNDVSRHNYTRLEGHAAILAAENASMPVARLFDDGDPCATLLPATEARAWLSAHEDAAAAIVFYEKVS